MPKSEIFEKELKDLLKKHNAEFLMVSNPRSIGSEYPEVRFVGTAETLKLPKFIYLEN